MSSGQRLQIKEYEDKDSKTKPVLSKPAIRPLVTIFPEGVTSHTKWDTKSNFGYPEF